MTTEGLHRRVAETVVARRLWSAGDRVAVAVSGGADSAVLLDLLVRSQGVHRGVLSVVTVDHGTRPGSADDVAWVVARAEHHGLPVHVVALDLGEDASEATCRSARYAALAALDVEVIALAHHRDDQAETTLLGLMRGGGTRAIAGMAWRRDRYARPLLDVSRAMLRTYASFRGLTWCDDPTNADRRFLRNRVRWEVMPLLEDLRPGCRAALARGAAHAAEDDAYLEQMSRQLEPFHDDGWPTSWVADAPAPIVRRAIRRRIPKAESRHLDALIHAARRGRGVVRLPEGSQVVVDGERVRMVQDAVPDSAIASTSGQG